jgi:predicted RNA-binding Zn ribbon-like protein
MVSTGRKPAGARREVPVFELTGGRLALDFPNTVDNRPVARRKDLLRDYADLVAWARQAGVLAEADARTLLLAARRRPAAAARVFARAIALREALYRVFAAAAAERRAAAPAAADLGLLEGEYRVAGAHARLVREVGTYAWGWAADPGELDRMLWPVARDAAELLASDQLPRVRECGADDCGWLFLDQSKNRSRVWCNMQVCGNRAKARRHYRKARAEAR